MASLQPQLPSGFLTADINLLARDLRLDLLKLRRFTRARYGFRSTKVEQILGIVSMAQMLSAMQQNICANTHLQANTLPETPPQMDDSLHLPRITSHFIQPADKRSLPSTNQLFFATPDIQRVLIMPSCSSLLDNPGGR